MGRSFDRGGQSRKERERGKRRNYRQEERDREAREAVIQAKRSALVATMARKRKAAAAAPEPETMPAPAAAALPAAETPQQPQVVVPLAPPARAAEARPGLLARMFAGIFKKSA